TLEIETNHSIGNDHLNPGIDASKLGSGNVDNIEFNYLDRVSSAIQSQFDGVGASLSGFNLTLGSLQAQLNGVSNSLDEVGASLSNVNLTLGGLQTQLNGVNNHLNNTVSDLSGLSTTVAGKVSKSGDTMTGALSLPLNGF